MYPFIRIAKESIRCRMLPPLGPWETHISHHMCWPWDIDPWWELNNGRTLTLYDLGRIPLAIRTGLVSTIRQKGWGLTMAGASVRWRRRVRAFERFEMRSRVMGFDARFLYIEQSMWKAGECANHVLLRAAVTDANGIVSTDRVLEAFPEPISAPALPDWIQDWISADAGRPWPPIT